MNTVTILLIVNFSIGLIMCVLWVVASVEEPAPITKDDATGQLVFMGIGFVLIPLWLPIIIVGIIAMFSEPAIKRLIDVYHIFNQKEPEDKENQNES